MKSFFIHHHGNHERVSSVGEALVFKVAGCMAGPVLWVFRQESNAFALQTVDDHIKWLVLSP